MVIQDNEALLRTFIVGDSQLRLELSKGPVWVLADRIELEQVLLNLVLNAITAVDIDGLVVISLSTVETKAILEIRDNGPGIPSEIRDWVLQPFHSTRSEGSGLGLSTVARIANSTGGEVLIKSATEGGACVRVTLPLSSSDFSYSETPLKHSLKSSSYTILLVEDDPHVSLTIENLLTAIGHQCIPVTNGIEALKVLEKRTDIELVLTDYQMPKLNGSELVNRIRCSGVQIPIIILSGYGASVNLHQDYRPNAILGKPVQLKKLNEAILTVMSEHSALNSTSDLDT